MVKRRCAEMLESGETPALSTDNTFLEGHCNGSQFADAPGLGDYYKTEAEAAGQDVKGKVYLSGLAEYPGDPRAWVSGRGDVKKVCEERNYKCQGAVDHKRDDGREPFRPVVLGEDIVQREVAEAIGRGSEKPMGELADEVKRKRKPHWAKE